MITWYKDTLVDDIHETKIQFCFYNNLGMNSEQVEFIRKLTEKYLKEYPAVGISKICDYFSWDYEETFSEYNYTHNDQGELYKDRNEIAQYCDEDKLIGFNHIRIHDMKLEDSITIQKVEECADRFNNLVDDYQKLKKRAKTVGLPVPEMNRVQMQHDIDLLEKHEIYTKKFSSDYFDVVLIRMLEESMFLKRIVIHELGHAIASTYDVSENSEILKLFEKYKDGFENIDEFIAECFMASELTNKISLANKVKERIIICKKVKFA